MDTLQEEDSIQSDPGPQQGRGDGQIGIMERGGSGEERIVAYSDLQTNEKENVLADLLVKSAINHALETQKEVGMTHSYCISDAS